MEDETLCSVLLETREGTLGGMCTFFIAIFGKRNTETIYVHVARKKGAELQGEIGHARTLFLAA